MSKQHYYVSKNKNNRFVFSQQDLFHIKKVMRYQINQEIIAIYNNNHHLLKITSLNPFKYCYLKTLAINNENNFHLSVILPLSNPKLNALMFQKAVELNANLIIPFCFQKSLVKINNLNYQQKLQRYQKIIKEAGEQSQRNQEVKIVDHLINQSEIKNYLLTNNFVCDLVGKPFLFSKLGLNKDTLIVIGPLKGFSKEERLFFKKLNF